MNLTDGDQSGCGWDPLKGDLVPTQYDGIRSQKELDIQFLHTSLHDSFKGKNINLLSWIPKLRPTSLVYGSSLPPESL